MMNERIKELAQQAGFEYDTRDCNFYHSYPAEQLNSNINEFAELIVKECARIAYEAPVGAAEGTILEHFGVEE